MASWARKFYAKRRDIALGENGDAEAFASIKKRRRTCLAAGTPPDSRLNELIALGLRRFVLIFVFVLVLVLWFLCWLLRLWSRLHLLRRLLPLFLLRLRLLLLLRRRLLPLLLLLLLHWLRIFPRGRRGIGRTDRWRLVVRLVAGRSVRLCVWWRCVRPIVGRVRRPNRCRLVVPFVTGRFIRLCVGRRCVRSIVGRVRRPNRCRLVVPFVTGRFVRLRVQRRCVRPIVGRVRRPSRCRLVVPLIAGRFIRLRVQRRCVRPIVGRVRRPNRCRLVVPLVAGRFVRLPIGALVPGRRNRRTIVVRVRRPNGCRLVVSLVTSRFVRLRVGALVAGRRSRRTIVVHLYLVYLGLLTRMTVLVVPRLSWLVNGIRRRRHLSRRRGNSNGRLGLLRLQLANLRYRYRFAAICLNRLVLLGEGRRWRRRRGLGDHGPILERGRGLDSGRC